MQATANAGVTPSLTPSPFAHMLPQTAAQEPKIDEVEMLQDASEEVVGGKWMRRCFRLQRFLQVGIPAAHQSSCNRLSASPLNTFAKDIREFHAKPLLRGPTGHIR